MTELDLKVPSLKLQGEHLSKFRTDFSLSTKPTALKKKSQGTENLNAATAGIV